MSRIILDLQMIDDFCCNLFEVCGFRHWLILSFEHLFILDKAPSTTHISLTDLTDLLITHRPISLNIFLSRLSPSRRTGNIRGEVFCTAETFFFCDMVGW